MAKPQLLLLHGALGSADSFKSLLPELDKIADTRAINFPGHGGLALPTQDFNTALFVKSLNDFIGEYFDSGAPVFIFGYSMGGYIALLSALQGNSAIKGIITLATKMHWSPEIAELECANLNPDILEQKVPQFAQQLEKIHAPENWKTIMQQTCIFLRFLGQTNPLSPEKIKDIKCPCLFMLGDRDKMVSLDETRAAFSAVEGASMSILPNTVHVFEKVNSERLLFEITQFINKN